MVIRGGRSWSHQKYNFLYTAKSSVTMLNFSNVDIATFCLVESVCVPCPNGIWLSCHVSLEACGVNWRASVASETLTGVTQSKIGDVCLFIYWRPSVASETVLGVDNAKSGICYIYVCMYGWYACPLNARAGNFFLLKTRLFRLDPSLF